MPRSAVTVALIAKQPLPGQVKTRLHPPLSLEQAAQLAAAAIADSVRALELVPAVRRILFFEGDLVPASASRFEVVAQGAGSLDVRLADLFDQVDEPLLLVGMDTPQLTPTHLEPVFNSGFLTHDAWIGPANDGGFWALAMAEPRGDLIRGVPMSKDDTGARQLARLTQAGLRVGTLQTLTDVDTIDDARDVAAADPTTQFARLLSEFGGEA